MTAFLFPGQGSQFVGMGRALAEASAEARGLYDAADELLGEPLSRICWEGPEERLTATENAQPAILLHSFAAWRSLPEAMRHSALVAAGHSLGEFTAYLAAGALQFEDALRVVRKRGEIMADAGRLRPGTMAAVIGLDPDEVEAACASVETGTVVPANLNAPGQVVISGDVEAVEAASALLVERGARRVAPLQVSGAFHSPLMAPAREELREALEQITLRDPQFPVVANATGEAVTSAAEARRLLVEQLTSPVRWIESMRTMAAMGPASWVELGPGNVLSGLLRRIDRAFTATPAGDPQALEQLAAADSSESRRRNGEG